MTSREGQQLLLDAELRWPLRSDVTYKDLRESARVHRAHRPACVCHAERQDCADRGVVG